MNTSFLLNTMNTTSDFLLRSAIPRLNPMVTFYTMWGIILFVGLMEVARLSSREDADEGPTKAQPIVWGFVGNHPDLKTPTPVYCRTYDSGKASYRWRKSDKSPWTYGSNPLGA
jgi:hypothetical protein